MHDVLAGYAFLLQEGVQHLGFVGHSFGGAVVIRAAAATGGTGTVITLASQSYGADPAAVLGPRFSLLLVHGTADETLPAACSVSIYRTASQPKKLLLLEGANHGLEPYRNEVYQALHDWIVEHLDPRQSP